MGKLTKTTIYFCTLIVFSFYPVQVVSASVQGEKKTEEKQVLSRWSEDSIFKKEIIIGGSWSDEKGEVAGRNSVGVEMLKKFSKE